MSEIEVDQEFTFDSPFEQYADRNGQHATVIGPTDPTTYDRDEVGSLWQIRFDDGTVIDAWPEEILGDWR